MRIADAVFILDNTQLPIFRFVFDYNVPSYDYIQEQLLSLKREKLYQNGIEITDNEASTRLVFSADMSTEVPSEGNSVTLDPVLKIDSEWSVAWSKFDGIYVTTVNRNGKDIIDVESDNEEQEEETSEEVDTINNENENSISKIVDLETRENYTSLSDQDSEEEIAELSQSDVEAISQREYRSDTVKQISNNLNPLQYLQFHEIFVEAMKMMIQTKKLTSHKIQLNAHRIVMLLKELVDASIPFITDLNQLRELIPNDSIIDKLVSTTKNIQNSAVTSISKIKKGESIDVPKLPKFSSSYHFVLEKSGNETPWRRLQVENVQNEVFVDVTESLEIMVLPTKRYNYNTRNTFLNYNGNAESINNDDYVKAIIHGQIELTTSLEGSPILELSLNKPVEISLPECYPSLHRAINTGIWKNSDGKSVQLIPPDEKSTLLSYHINLKELAENSSQQLNISRFTGSISAELYSGIGINRNEFEIIINSGYGLNSGYGNTDSNMKEVENLSIEICLSATAENLDGLKKDLKIDNPNLKIIRSSAGSVYQIDNGNYEWKLDSDAPIGGKLTLRGMFQYEKDDFIQDNIAILLPSALKIKYKHHGTVPSGLRINGINIISEKVNTKPFKGVKYTSISNDYVVT
ncbi:hypothetical protein CANINC_001391 [Pichia inconspicua]|uniref:MHD domain-containing protein n=1 Tax=Pichia inconspicua TaxID=52247 RepID=A0A4T0X502_9ASCO|nr:hypothetical protein CANINC_001391 [[Candida] inconspicua]